MPNLILASGSPRRSKFFSMLGIDFSIIIPNIDETPLAGELPKDLVSRLSYQKACSVAKDNYGSIVVAADTVIDLDGKILGKPGNREESIQMLKMLSGRSHLVYTGVAVVFQDKTRKIIEETKITFAPVSNELASFYADTEEGLDKAGGYAIQGIASMFIEKIEGSLSSVIGLPFSQVMNILMEFGIRPEFKAEKM